MDYSKHNFVGRELGVNVRNLEVASFLISSAALWENLPGGPKKWLDIKEDLLRVAYHARKQLEAAGEDTGTVEELTHFGFLEEIAETERQRAIELVEQLDPRVT